MMEALAQFEWALILLLVLGLAVWELLRLRREQRRDRARSSGAES
ncbi:hypothetical protein [Belnapia rosea]|uniref:Uncharacterized protein n=1 Tax=Belnapia rosea TaxID=938405 RepID=A0A1G6YGM4_9PROT|nr:hypothetical protein [Belnapia rosea]SDB71023.1 hypothetical protein SAMN02927895_03946 [Belnapia rosea]SDD89143.1 hypothetical protein SAMN04487779_101445 [Belnapia rosea]